MAAITATTVTTTAIATMATITTMDGSVTTTGITPGTTTRGIAGTIAAAIGPGPGGVGRTSPAWTTTIEPNTRPGAVRPGGHHASRSISFFKLLTSRFPKLVTSRLTISAK